MPELPEVETVCCDLREAGIEGKTIKAIRVCRHQTLATHSAAAAGRLLKNRRILSVSRRAKYIVMTLSDGLWLIIHLRMTGQLRMGSPREPMDAHDRIRLDFTDGSSLIYHDTRAFGRWYCVRDPNTLLAKLGPEPLDKAFTARQLTQILTSRNRALKPLLLDQTVIAGLGNIYVDEALWDAKLHPERRSASLTKAECLRLYRAIRKVLRIGIANLGTTLGTGETNFYSVARRRGGNQSTLKVFRRTGEPCPKCHTTIERLIVGQRSTHICPACQTLDSRPV